MKILIANLFIVACAARVDVGEVDKNSDSTQCDNVHENEVIEKLPFKDAYSLKGKIDFIETCKTIVKDLYISELNKPENFNVLIEDAKPKSRSTKTCTLGIYEKKDMEMKDRKLEIIISFYDDEFYFTIASGILLKSDGISQLKAGDIEARVLKNAAKIASAMQWTGYQDISDIHGVIKRIDFVSQKGTVPAEFSAETGLLFHLGYFPPPD